MWRTVGLILVSLVSLGSCLECYTCITQDNNKDKCIKTTKQCTEEQNRCVSVVKWGIPPYWTPHGDRIHMISKECSTQPMCEQKMRNNTRTCKRDWYDDWMCVECCSGDLCNYYVTLGAGTAHAQIVLILTALLAAFFC